MAEHDEFIKQVNELENNQTPEKKKKKSIRNILNILLVLGLTALAVFLTLNGNIDEIMDNLAKCDYSYLLIAVGVLLGAILIASLVTFCFARLYTRRYHLHQAIAVDFIGTFYNAVTPGASGGQVMQAYTLKKQGIPISSAVSMLAMSSIIYQVVLIGYGILAFILKNDIIMSIGNAHLGSIGDWNIDVSMLALTIIGFLLNVAVILLVLLMGYWKGFHNFIMGPMINLFTKMHMIKKPEKTRENLRVQVENFKVEMRRLFSNIPFTILVTVLFTFYLTVKFSVPYFVGTSLGNESNIASFWDCVLLSNYHQMITGIIPIPGAAGVSELVFRMMFVNKSATADNSFFFVDQASKNPLLVSELINQWMSDPEMAKTLEGLTIEEINERATVHINTLYSTSMANAALLLWRTITFIIPVTIGGFVSAFYRASPKEEVTREGIPNRQTFIDLQKDTYVARKEELDTMAATSRLTREEILKRLRSIGQKSKRKSKTKNKSPEDFNQNRYDNFNIDDEDDSIR